MFEAALVITEAVSENSFVLCVLPLLGLLLSFGPLSTAIVAFTVLEELSITETEFERVLATYILPLLGTYSKLLGSKPTGIVAFTVLEELSITETEFERVLATYILPLLGTYSKLLGSKPTGIVAFT